MTKKIDFSSIIKDHFKTFHVHSNGGVSWADWTLFIGFPILVAVAISLTDFKLNNELITAVITAASIFAGLLLNLLVLIYTILIKDRENAFKSMSATQISNWKNLVCETFANVSFCILMSIFLVALSLLYYLNSQPITLVIRPLLCFFSISLILHLFMVLKRVHRLISFESSQPSETH